MTAATEQISDARFYGVLSELMIEHDLIARDISVNYIDASLISVNVFTRAQVEAWARVFDAPVSPMPHADTVQYRAWSLPIAGRRVTVCAIVPNEPEPVLAPAVVEPEAVEPEPVDSDATPTEVAVRGYFDTAEWSALTPDQVAALVELCALSGWWGDWKAAYRQVATDATPVHTGCDGAGCTSCGFSGRATDLPRRTPGAALAAEPAPDDLTWEAMAQQGDSTLSVYFGARWGRLTADQRQRLAVRCLDSGPWWATWERAYREIVAETRTDLPIYQQRTAGSLR